MVRASTVIAMLGAAACSRAMARPASPAEGSPSAGAPTRGRWVAGEFTGAAGTRRWQLYLPGSYDPKRPHMLVVLLHGCTQDAADIARGTRVAEHAERDGFLALLPEQPESANPKKCWNWYDPAHQLRDAGEPALIAGLTGRVIQDYAVDPSRVHIAGISAGAAMASLVAIAYPERYASVAMHSGIPWRGATSVVEALAAMSQGVDAARAVKLGADAVAGMGERARPIPALVIQGGADRVVNPGNARALVAQWLSMFGMTGHPRARDPQAGATRDSAETNGYHWQRSRIAGGDIEEIVVTELGHAWSGGSREGTFTDEHGPDALAEIVAFFRAHPRGR